jgi:hypothetical protein
MIEKLIHDINLSSHEIILEWVVGTGWSWLRIGTGGGHLWVQCGTFGLHKCGEFLDLLQSLLVSFSRRTLLHGVSK